MEVSAASLVPLNTSNGDITVYVTDSGDKYHSAGCGYLSRSCNEMTLSNAVRTGKTPCSRCNPPILSEDYDNALSFGTQYTVEDVERMIEKHKNNISLKIDLENMVFQGGMKTAAGKNRIVPIHPDILPYLSALGIDRHTPHDCRHTFSWLCDKYNVDQLSKKLMLGHTLGYDVTDAVYGHRSLDELRAEIQKIKCY